MDRAIVDVRAGTETAAGIAFAGISPIRPVRALEGLAFVDGWVHHSLQAGSAPQGLGAVERQWTTVRRRCLMRHSSR